MSTELKKFSEKKTQTDIFYILISAEKMFFYKKFYSPRQKLEHDMGWYSLAIWTKGKRLPFQESWPLPPTIERWNVFQFNKLIADYISDSKRHV